MNKVLKPVFLIVIFNLMACNARLNDNNSNSAVSTQDEEKAFQISMSPDDRNEVEHLQSEMGALESIDERVEYVSSQFLGRNSGWQQSTQDLAEIKEEELSVNFWFHDCVRYVEQSIALARSRFVDDFLTELRKIRYYDSKVMMSQRLHFPEADWIPENIRNKNLKDSTSTVAKAFNPGALKVASTQVNKAKWFGGLYSAYLPELLKYSSAKLQITASLEFLDFDALWTRPIENRTDNENNVFLAQEAELFNRITSESEVRAKKILTNKLDTLRKTHRLNASELDDKFVQAMPKLSIVFLVRPSHKVEKDGALLTPMLITHMGIVVKRVVNMQEKLFFRHAPSKAGSVVSEVPFEDYFSNFLVTGSVTDKATDRRSSWKGISVYTLNP